MKRTVLILAALLAAGTAQAGGFRLQAGSVAASGFASFGQSGNWTAGAMNESFGTAKAVPSCTGCGRGAEIITSGGSVTEGFGTNFRGFSAAGGLGGGTGRAFGRLR